jgi:hypothetical protein
MCFRLSSSRQVLLFTLPTARAVGTTVIIAGSTNGVPGGVGGQANERQGSTETQDVFGTRIRLTRDGLTVGSEFVPFGEMGGRRPESHVFWNPGTRLFEVAVFRRNGPDLTIRNLPLHTAEQLREAIIEALRGRRT